jgi:hypothetical protein
MVTFNLEQTKKFLKIRLKHYNRSYKRPLIYASVLYKVFFKHLKDLIDFEELQVGTLWVTLHSREKMQKLNSLF